MATELLPVVDLHALSQTDLDAFAAASAHALAPESFPDAYPLPPLKIDRAVSDESAGSRKQTFSRLRLAATSSSQIARSASARFATPSSVRNDPDSGLFAYHVRRLFVPDDPSTPPPPEPQTLALTVTSPSPPRSPPPDPDREIINFKGFSVDLVRLAGMEDPYDAEVRRRTAGLVSETELLGFIASLAGKWASRKEQRRFVDASFFGDHLPRGWKLLLGLKRKDRTAWVHCFSYVSPKGSQFATCKNVSAYLMSLLGYPKDQIFHSQNNHEVTAKKRRGGKFGEPIVGKDGKFECPVCHKSFTEESRYFGHIGSHARYQGVTPGAFLNMITSGKVDNNSLAQISFGLQELEHIGEADYQHLSGSEMTIYNEQTSSHHVFRPNTFGCGNPYEVLLVDHGMASKHGEINNTVKARDVNLSACLGTSYLPVSGASNETSAALNEASQSSFTSCFASTNGKGMMLDVANKTPVAASTCFNASYANNTGGGKANFLGSMNNTVAYQSNMGTRPVSSMETEAGCFASHSAHPENCGNRLASSTKEQMGNTKNRARNNTGFGEAYNDNNIRGFTQFSRRFTQMKRSFSSHHSPPESNTLKASSLTKGTDANLMNGPLVNRSVANCMRDSLVNRHISNNELNISMREMMEKSRDEMHNCNDHAPACVLQAAGSASQNVNGPMSTQANVGSRSSMFRSAGDASVGSTTQDQCDLQLGFGAHKQQIFSGYEELRPTTSGSPLPGVHRNNSRPTRPSEFGSGPDSFPSGSSQFGSLDRPNAVPISLQFGIMARPNSVPLAESSQFRGMSPNSVPHEKSTQFASMARPNCIPPPDSSQFGSMDRPNSVPHAKSSQFGSMVRPNYIPPASSSQFGSMARSSSFLPAEVSEFGNTTMHNLVSRTEPTLVLGYAPQMGNGPPVQVGWELSSQKITGDMMTCVCVWCNSQFHHFGPPDEQQTSSFGFICPACKEKVSRHPNMRNNGSWHP